MRVWRAEEARSARLEARPVLALGFFDGIHRGHRALVRRAVADAAKLEGPAGVLTFEPHPLVVLRPGRPVDLLTTADEKEQLLAGLGVEVALFYPFSRELAALPAEEFVQAVLVEQLHVAEVVVGYNFTFGAGGAGHYGLLRRMGEKAGFRAVVIPPVRLVGEVVSSTAVREKLVAGEVERAAHLLGYDYRLAGRVVRGAGRGRGLGFPTANLALPPEKLVPADGVYLVGVDLPGEVAERPGLAAVGRAATFGGEERQLEVHVPGFAGDLYGAELRLRFLRRLRGMRRFASAEGLKAQVERDLSQAATWWQERPGAGLQP